MILQNDEITSKMALYAECNTALDSMEKFIEFSESIMLTLLAVEDKDTLTVLLGLFKVPYLLYGSYLRSVFDSL